VEIVYILSILVVLVGTWVQPLGTPSATLVWRLAQSEQSPSLSMVLGNLETQHALTIDNDDDHGIEY